MPEKTFAVLAGRRTADLVALEQVQAHAARYRLDQTGTVVPA